MKQTNYHLFDFLDFSPDLDGKDILWRACKPVNAREEKGDIVVTIPFQKQKCSKDIIADREASRKDYSLRIRAYGEKIIRISIGFGTDNMPDSPMLAMDPELEHRTLHVDRSEVEWIIRDTHGEKKAVFDLRDHETDHCRQTERNPGCGGYPQCLPGTRVTRPVRQGCYQSGDYP